MSAGDLSKSVFELSSKDYRDHIEQIQSKYLRFVKLQNCKVQSLIQFPSLSNLLVLDLSGNQIATLNYSKFWEQLRSLYVLNLSSNKIQLDAELKSLRPLQNLFYLDLSNNKIRDYKQLIFDTLPNLQLQLWEVELLFLVYYVSNYILKYFATSNADDKFQQIISSWRLFMNYSLTQEGQKYDFDRIRPQSTIQSRYLIFQKGKIEITTCNKRTAMTKINAVEDVQEGQLIHLTNLGSSEAFYSLHFWVQRRIHKILYQSELVISLFKMSLQFLVLVNKLI
ncbi:Acidic_leucine-rich nuclear phosphoprotein 32 family member A [Hexamita inflata]|uniref:Acidic leucine-rich nuclear phosphoprotein 32 family member A n=1 Tax=Hexamita inflata TaxID=28002 RepID=A0AA86PV41_9EUKA|nr:Acidic leucine-rich nuclear phosphoprotein 32 family member A [Hexamita inflata]